MFFPTVFSVLSERLRVIVVKNFGLKKRGGLLRILGFFVFFVTTFYRPTCSDFCTSFALLVTFVNIFRSG